MMFDFPAAKIRFFVNNESGFVHSNPSTANKKKRDKYECPVILSSKDDLLIGNDIEDLLTTVFRVFVLVKNGVILVSLESINEIVTLFEILGQLVVEIGRNSQISLERKTGVSLQIRETDIPSPSVVTFPE